MGEARDEELETRQEPQRTQTKAAMKKAAENKMATTMATGHISLT